MKQWSLNKTLEEKIDTFHRKQIRRVLGIHYPKIIKNEEIYKIKGITPWSQIIKQRRLKFVGHILRLDNETPIKKAIIECVTEYKLKQGRPKTTWIRTIYNDFNKIIGSNHLNIDFINKLTEITKDKEKFNNIVKSLMEQ